MQVQQQMFCAFSEDEGSRAQVSCRTTISTAVHSPDS